MEHVNVSNVDLPTLANAMYAWCFQTKVILDRVKETGELPWQQAVSVTPCYS
jgi:hypothetical protein